jgi:hypothetical protein
MLTPVSDNRLRRLKLGSSHNEAREVRCLQFCRNMSRHRNCVSFNVIVGFVVVVAVVAVVAYDAFPQAMRGCLEEVRIDLLDRPRPFSGTPLSP